MEVAPGVYWLPLRGGNAFLLVEGRLTLIDTGMKGSSRRLLRFLRRMGRSPEEIGLILLTHYHVDHAGGLAEVQRLTRAPTLAHRSDAPYIRHGLPQPLPVRGLLRLLLRPLQPLMRNPPARVDRELEGGEELEVGGGLKVIHTPGHTPGSLSFYLPEKKLVLAGDTLQNRRGRLGLASRIYSVNWEQARASAEEIAGLDFENLGAGHGPPLVGNAARRLRSLL